LIDYLNVGEYFGHDDESPFSVYCTVFTYLGHIKLLSAASRKKAPFSLNVNETTLLPAAN